jgi:hypothetical protein
MKKTIILITLLLIGMMTFLPVALADETDQQQVTTETTVLSEDGVQSISPEEAANRISTGFLKLYKNGITFIPNLALVALLFGAIIAMLAAAFNLERILKGSILGMVVVLAAVAIVYAGPFLTAIAKGFGEGL